MNASTPAIVMLNDCGISFLVHEFHHEPGGANFGQAAAQALAIDPDRVFKTLVVLIDDRATVAIVPVSGKLSLKLLAAAVGAKRAEMCPIDIAERTTGYVIGGISPFGQKRQLPSVIDETCVLFDSIFVSGGKRGLDLEIAPADLVEVLAATVAAIAQ